MTIQRISHLAFSGAKLQDTIQFYTQVLGMDLVIREPVRDDTSKERVIFHAGGDTFIVYTLAKEGGQSGMDGPQSGVAGSCDVTLEVDAIGLDRTLERLRSAGAVVAGPVDRGHERIFSFKDPNGVTVELAVWPSAPPAQLSRAAILRRAQQLRELRRATFIEEQDIREAISDVQDEADGRRSADIVAEASEESFPASDPPAW